MAGSRRLMLGEAMSIFARRMCAPSGNSPFCMRLKVHVSSALRLRNGESLPGSFSVPRFARISSALWLST